jgi:2-isopropylmalate synthase
MVELLDSTLREGEQTPGVRFTTGQKLEIADLLDRFGIDIIEAGHPAVSREIHRDVRMIADQGYGAGVLAHSRAMRADIDRALSCDVEWIGIFYCVAEKGLRERFNTDRPAAIERITDSIRYAKEHGLRVRYTPEDSFRTEWDGLIEVCRAAQEAGADRISLADTVGCMRPGSMRDFVTRFREEITVPIHVHCHNDLGMATANSLEAVEAGAHLIDVTVNGLGERTGIAPLAETVVALKLLHRHDRDLDLALLPELSETVARYSGIPVHSQAPVVGDNAFSHNAGLHVAAVVKDPGHYESIPIDLVGRRRTIVLDHMAGKDTLRHKLREWKLTLDDDQIQYLQDFVTNRPVPGDATGERGSGTVCERQAYEYARMLTRIPVALGIHGGPEGFQPSFG